MLLIPCPWCGPRNETEFHYGGQAHLKDPGQHEQLSDGQWADYLYMRDNPKGWFAERWVHSHGCRRWFNVERHTVTNAFGPAYKPGEPKPKRPE